MSVKSSCSDGRWDHTGRSLQSCPSQRPSYLTPSANRPLRFFAPDVQDSCTGSEQWVVLLVCNLHPCSRQHVRDGRGTGCSLGRALRFMAFLSDLAPGCCIADTGSGQPAPGSTDGGRDMLLGQGVPALCTACRTCWVCADTKPPPPGHCSMRICQIS